MILEERGNTIGTFAVTSVYFNVNFEVDYEVEVEREVNLLFVRIIVKLVSVYNNFLQVISLLIPLNT